MKVKPIIVSALLLVTANVIAQGNSNQIPVKTEFKQIPLSDKRCQNALEQAPSFERRSARCCQVKIEHYENPKTKRIKEVKSTHPLNRCGSGGM